MTVIDVPDIQGPKTRQCFKQAETMERCDRAFGHSGRHSWELVARIVEQEATIQAQKKQLSDLEGKAERLLAVVKAMHDKLGGEQVSEGGIILPGTMRRPN